MAIPIGRMTYKPQIYTSGVDQRGKFSVIVQGTPGAGKTHFMMTCPNPLVLVWDTNLATHYKFEGIPYVLIRSWAEVEDFWIPTIKDRGLTATVQAFQNPDGTKPFASYKVETLCLDTLSAFVKLILMELADGHAKFTGKGNRDKWDEYYSRIHRLLDASVKSTEPDPAHPEREIYYMVAGVHEEPLYETIMKDGEEAGRRLIGYKPTIAGKMGNAGELFTYFSTHLLCEAVDSPGKLTSHQFRTRSFGIRKVMPDKVAGTKWSVLPETLPNTWPDLMKAWGM